MLNPPPAVTTITHAYSFDQRRQFIIQLFQLLPPVLQLCVDVFLANIDDADDPDHTPVLSGHQWVLELIHGHPGRIRSELGLSKEVFLQLITELRSIGFADTEKITLEEEVAIFMYTCMTGLTTRCVRKRFQRTTDTITRSFRKILYVLSSAPFYTKFIQSPTKESSSNIRSNPKLWPYFRDVIGAIDGIHVPVVPTADLDEGFRDRRRIHSQNTLFVCNFDLKFTYLVTGWEGFAADEHVYRDAISRGLRVPKGKYLLGDASYYPQWHPQLLVPYRVIRYHLAKGAPGGQRPRSKEELFNRRHAAARDAIEQLSGNLKRKYRLLRFPLESPFEHQVRVPVALAALHNFEQVYEPTVRDDGDISDRKDCSDGDEDDDMMVDDAKNDGSTDLMRQCYETGLMRDRIAQRMWDDYQEGLSQSRCAGVADAEGDDGDCDMDL